MRIEEAIKKLMVIEPFYGLLAIGIWKGFSELVPTGCLELDPKNLSFNLHVNPSYWDKLIDDHKVGLIQHEMLHLCEFDLFDLDHYDDRDLANIAMDMRKNQYIQEQNIPPKWIRLNSFPPDIFPPLLSSREYYELLKKASTTNQNLQNLLKAMGDGKKTICWHGLWDQNNGSDGQPMPDNIKHLFKKQIEHQIKEIYENYANKNIGFFPAHLFELIKRLTTKVEPVTNWRDVVRRFGSNSIQIETKTSRSKLNPRYPDDPAIKIIERKSLIAAIDTSGSMSTKEIQDFFKQVDYIYRLGIDITVIQCDADIHSILPYKKNIGDTIKVSGRDGTDFEPVIKLLNETKRYNGLIYYTDGHGSFSSPLRKPCLWVISEKGTTTFTQQGYVLYTKGKNGI